ncbi:MAG TPA: CBS domain-containing protein [Desulfomonilaceae bacterium]|nr:CBS domain-containing protein [Desulfomonilaceae bacterium]
MSEPKVRDLMLSSYQCATVSENASLCEAVIVMEATRKMYQRWDYRPRIVLVLNEKQNVIGTVRHYDILRALEPHYKEFGLTPQAFGSETATEFIQSTYQHFDMWKGDLEARCKKASELKVTHLMKTPARTEFINVEIPLCEAIHRMLMGNHPSLIVSDSGGFLGILRMSDVANYVINTLKTLCTAAG